MTNDDQGRPNWDDPTPGYEGTPNYPGSGQQPGRTYGGRREPVRPGNYGRHGGDYGGYAPPAPQSWAARNRSMITVVAAFLVVLVLGAGGWALLSPDSDTGSRSSIAAGGTSDAPATTLDVPTTTPPAPTTTPPATKTTKKVLPKATTTPPPPAKKEIPPPPPAPIPGCTAATYNGTNAPRDQVKAALVAAGKVEYWQGVQLDPHLTVPLPKITIPENLMKAIAWQESGWQSAIESCDHGIGTMQVMKGTADDTNNRFGTNFDINTLAGNTQLGAEYLERAIMYFGIYHFDQHFDLDTVAQVGPNGEQYSLLQVVIAAYNVGFEGVEDGHGNIRIGPIGTTYSNSVLALMQNCECLSF